MATTTRTRKTAAKTAAVDETEESTTAATEGDPGAEENTEAADTDGGPKAPDTAPLEPPTNTVHAAPDGPAEPGYVSPTEVIPDNIAEVILDDATKKPPADVAAVFQPVTPYGSTLVCTVRLVERTFIGPHASPVERLLQPKGAHVSESIAARIRERLEAQAAATDTEK